MAILQLWLTQAVQLLQHHTVLGFLGHTVAQHHVITDSCSHKQTVPRELPGTEAKCPETVCTCTSKTSCLPKHLGKSSAGNDPWTMAMWQNKFLAHGKTYPGKTGGSTTWTLSNWCHQTSLRIQQYGKLYPVLRDTPTAIECTGMAGTKVSELCNGSKGSLVCKKNTSQVILT